MTASVFPQDYRDSRAAFVRRARGAGAGLVTLSHPLQGSDGEAVATDVACFGPEHASRVLIVVSGTHGAEGLCGAGIQAALLERRVHAEHAGAVRIVLVHALNPHGFLDLRRTNEDNVDLNRNFIDHDGGHPDDSAYAEVHADLVPEDWDGPSRARADAALARYVGERGAAALQAAVSRGQYSFADGLFYGGRAAAWSNRTWRRILSSYASAARYLAVVDLHSGLGARGACELISGAAPGSREHSVAGWWFGDELVVPGLDSTAPPATGFMAGSLAQVLPDAHGALVVAEFGTLPFDVVFNALRADNWLHARPGRAQRDSRLWRETKATMEEAFVGRDAAWQEAVTERGVAIVRRALGGLLDTLDGNTARRGVAQ